MDSIFSLSPSRIFLSPKGVKCPFGCSYCFANFSQYEPQQYLDDFLDGKINYQPGDIIYPACDVEFFRMEGWQEILEKLCKLPIVISISTKAKLSIDDAYKIEKSYRSAIKCGGFLKVGISISTKYSVMTIEPRTPLYAHRLSSASLLSSANVPCCLILKPLHYNISTAEYFEIICDFSSFTSTILTGDLYLDDGDEDEVTKNSKTRKVSWIRQENKWNFICMKKKISELEDFIKSRQLTCCHSDEEAIRSLRETNHHEY